MAEKMLDGKFTHNSTTAPSETRVLPLFSLKGRTAIVTGAGAGIGLAVAQALAEAGANVAIWYNSNRAAHDAASQIASTYNVQCKAYQVDVTSPEAVDSAVDKIVDEFGGRLDVFVANSGVAWEQGPIIDGGLDHYRKVMATNVDGTVYCARSAGRVWRRQRRDGTNSKGEKLEGGWGGGSFIATASMSGHIANVPQLQAAYNASKAGVIHLCKSLAVEWAGFARANSVSPGYINTEISKFNSPEVREVWSDKIPMGREGEPSELKGVYLYLASDASSYTTGSDIIVDGGYCAP
ncbi:sorbitol utilization protein SOU2 [Coniochaeta sp. 2T2.1]|nr:sorbitol utilization protein SOU2 [Coniochaeta sp. 2T2.1]